MIREIIDVGFLDRGNVGVLGVTAAGCEARIRELFTQERVAASAGSFLDGPLGDERRKTGWTRAEAAGDPGPWRQRAILGRGRWDADALRDVVRDYVVGHPAADDAVLVIDETGFLRLISTLRNTTTRTPACGRAAC